MMNELINEYLLVIQPNEDLCERIMTMKQHFAGNYQCPQATHIKPQITLIKFSHYEMAESRFVHRFRNIAAVNAPFKITLNDFGSLPSHTIYINIQTTNQLTVLSKELRQVQAFILPDKQNKPHFITEPVINIAHKLLPWQYEKGWLEYSNTHFNASFTVNEMLLLKRREGTNGYKTLARFPLLSQVKKLEQASMF
jgi:2'-5' RNA ligase